MSCQLKNMLLKTNYKMIKSDVLIKKTFFHSANVMTFGIQELQYYVKWILCINYKYIDTMF